MRLRVVLAALLLAVAAAVTIALWRHPVGLADVGAAVAGLTDWRQAHPWQAAGLYFAAYVAVTALSLPLATWVTLAGGALFGFWQGLVLISFASTLGATLAFLAARFILGGWVANTLGGRLKQVRDGLSRDGAFYLFTLRLIPVVPFFAVNLLMGLTEMRVGRFWWISQLGMLAGTAVYVNAGTRLAQIDSLAGLLSPGLIGSFVLLGLFPWIARPVVAWLRRRRILARWDRPRRFDRNLIVIGAGAAGLVAANIAAAAKARVTLVEAGEMGGECLNTGCVPSKALIHSAKLAHDMRHAGRHGLADTPPAIPFARVMERVFEVIARIAPHDSAERYRALGVEVLHGHGRLIDPWTVEITGTGTGAEGATRLTSRAIVLATGAAPVMPDLPGIGEVEVLTSETLWQALRHADSPPKRLAILGGGPVGCELAQAFARLGSAVTLIARGPQLLAREDADVGALARAALEADGVTVLTATAARACGVTDGQPWIAVEAEGGGRQIPFDRLIAAIGREARLEGFGLEALGIETGEAIGTDAWLRTRYPNILVCGDAAGPHQFTHAGADQATVAALNALAAPFWRRKADTRPLPACTFLDPQIARVGLNEREAKAGDIAHEVTRYPLADLDRALTDSAPQGFVKVLTPPGKDRILGVTIVGAGAGEMLAEFVLAMTHGLGLRKVLGTIHAYPTLAEANRNAAAAWQRAHVGPRLLALAGRFHRWRRGG